MEQVLEERVPVLQLRKLSAMMSELVNRVDSLEKENAEIREQSFA